MYIIWKEKGDNGKLDLQIGWKYDTLGIKVISMYYLQS